jgi:tetratricopeptide (TPR) repeat protein
MATDVRGQLQATLSGSYTLERELGGGGMSRVFLAEETRLGRKVVVKVLSSELAASLSAERFEREIRVAASLQQANIVPLLSAGDAGGLPYYTMPFVEGQSLRTKLGDGPLSITQAVGVLKDVARALSYAHEHGVVHRDIKPDNVLLSGGAAVVTDFGIAKAISASRTGPGAGTLTQIGTSIGTPAYMAPEQAAGDPDIDHRADIYAFGCLAYELLTGRSPFHDQSPQRMLAAHMKDTPQYVAELRLDLSSALAALVMKCLAKEASARPQRAADLLHTLESVTSAGTQPAMPSILIGGPGMLKKALLLYAGAFLAVAILARAAIVAIGLPDWVFPGALIVMALGLPVILFTGYVHHVARQIAITTSPQITPGGTPSTTHGTLAQIAVKASPHVSWRRAALGGVYALGFLALLVAGYMILRALGVGPIGSLLAKGALERNQRILVADFRQTGSDTTLGTVVSEAFRTGLGQSQSIVVMPATSVREVLRRMQKPAGALVDASLAREIATREGMKAFIDGEILGIGGKYALSARLTETLTGNVLASFQETADSEAEILSAIDRLTRRFRERIGESLRKIRDTRALEQVTTPSLPALKKYVQGNNALSFDGDFDRGVALLEEATTLDTGFAMAYRKLAVEYNNRGDAVRAMQFIAKAYEHRDRLSETERYFTMASYYSYGPQQDPAKAVQAYESLLDLQPDNATALNNAAVRFTLMREFERAEELLARAVALPEAPAVAVVNFGNAGLRHGDTARARKATEELEKRFGRNAFATLGRVRLLYGLGDVDSATALARSLRRSAGSDAASRALATQVLGGLSAREGRIAEARRYVAEGWGMRVDRLAAPLQAALADAWLDGWHRGDLANARRKVDRALGEHPLSAIPHVGRPYATTVEVLALVGNVEQAKAVVSLFERERASIKLTSDARVLHQMQGDIALAEREYERAVREYRESDAASPCSICALPRVARAYDLAGHTDSAIAVFSRFVATLDPGRIVPGPGGSSTDPDFLAGSYKRLGELLEQKGDRQMALGYYLKFVDLWKNADPELQPKVTEVRQRIARLKDAEGR